ncbi:MAG: hypothetical protein ACM3N9_01260 [Syntrophothermus sp.]
MIRSIVIFFSILQLLLFPVIIPQQKIAGAKEIDNRFSQVWKSTEASRKIYTWKAETEVVRNAKTIQILVEKVTYDQGGKEIRQVISNKEEALPGGFIVGRIAADQKAKIVEFMKEMRLFLEKYALADDDKRHTFFTNAAITGPDAKGVIQIAGTDIFAKGDRLKWWINTKTYSITYATISTTYKDVAVDFSGTYLLLPNLNYMSTATINIPSKDMVVRLRFYDFEKK